MCSQCSLREALQCLAWLLQLKFLQAVDKKPHGPFHCKQPWEKKQNVCFFNKISAQCIHIMHCKKAKQLLDPLYANPLVPPTTLRRQPGKSPVIHREFNDESFSAIVNVFIYGTFAHTRDSANASAVQFVCLSPVASIDGLGA